MIDFKYNYIYVGSVHGLYICTYHILRIYECMMCITFFRWVSLVAAFSCVRRLIEHVFFFVGDDIFRKEVVCT